MKKPDAEDRDSQASNEPNEGEGSTTAARHYDDGVAKTVKSGTVEQKAREAAEALDGEEGEELRRAEALGKQPPHQKQQ